MIKLTPLAALTAVVAFAAAAPAADKVDNPEYKNWAGFKAGSTVVLKMTSDAGGQKFESTITTKLVEVKDDKLVVETSAVNKFMGQETKGDPMKRDVPKQLDKAPMGFDVKTGKPDGTTEEGKEKVKVGGTEYNTQWYKFKSSQKLPTGGDLEVEGQLWMSDEVPGKLVKMTSKTKDGGMTMEATEITIKK